MVTFLVIDWCFTQAALGHRQQPRSPIHPVSRKTFRALDVTDVTDVTGKSLRP